jgi:predicted CXXCH cytochrome family protein
MPQAKSMRRVLIILAVALTGIGGFWRALRAPLPKPAGMPAWPVITEFVADLDTGWQTQSEYVGSQACRKCHPDQFASYQDTAHSRTLTEVEPELEPLDGTFDHEPSNRRYRTIRREGQVVHEETLLLADGSEFAPTSIPLRYRVGSGNFGRTYLCDGGNGFLVESPVTWYEPTKSWGMSPGYDNARNQSFTRLVPENCLFCHVGQVETNAASDFRMRLSENAIGCERCHGPGRSHVELCSAARAPDSATENSIVNPRRLSRQLSEAICQQCHLQGDVHVLARNVRMADYRPGLPLEGFRCEFRFRTPSSMQIVGHVEQMWQSACYRRSESLTCTTCHDPHFPVAPAERTAHYRAVCLTCHGDPGCRLPLVTREGSQNDCVHCHMPHAATEVPHVAFTHHHIGIHPLTDQPVGIGDDVIHALSDLSQLSEADRQRTKALAWDQLWQRIGSDRQSRTARAVDRQIDDLLDRLPVGVIDFQVETARAELFLARGKHANAAHAAVRALDFADIRTDEQARVLVVLATIEFGQNLFEEARLRFETLSRLRINARDWYYLGLCENNCGRVEEAIRALQKSLELDPASVGTYEALAAIHHARLELDAERRLRESITRLNLWESQRGESRDRTR